MKINHLQDLGVCYQSLLNCFEQANTIAYRDYSFPEQSLHTPIINKLESALRHMDELFALKDDDALQQKPNQASLVDLAEAGNFHPKTQGDLLALNIIKDFCLAALRLNQIEILGEYKFEAKQECSNILQKFLRNYFLDEIIDTIKMLFEGLSDFCKAKVAEFILHCDIKKLTQLQELANFKWSRIPPPLYSQSKICTYVRELSQLIASSQDDDTDFLIKDFVSQSLPELTGDSLYNYEGEDPGTWKALIGTTKGS